MLAAGLRPGKEEKPGVSAMTYYKIYIVKFITHPLFIWLGSYLCIYITQWDVTKSSLNFFYRLFPNCVLPGNQQRARTQRDSTGWIRTGSDVDPGPDQQGILPEIQT